MGQKEKTDIPVKKCQFIVSLFYLYRFIQVVGEKAIISGNISSLPRSIANESNTLEKGE